MKSSHQLRFGSRHPVALLIMGMMAASPAAHAAVQTRWAVTAGVLHTDNIEKVVDAKRSADTPEAGIVLEVIAKRPRFSFSLDSDVTYSAYEQQLYARTSSPNAARGAATLRAVADIMPARLEWRFHDTLGTAPVTAIAPDTPANRQLANLVGTGPAIKLPLGTRGLLSIEGEWFQSKYGTTATDTKGYQGTVGLSRLLSRTLTLTLDGTASGITYISLPALGEFRVTSATVSLGRKSRRSDASLEVGKTWLKSRGISESSPLIRVLFRHASSAQSTLSLRLGREYSNSALSLQSNFDFYGVASTLRGASPTPESFRSDYSQLMWTLDEHRFDLSVQALTRRELYFVSHSQDSTLYGGGVLLGRALGPKLRLGLWTRLERRDIRALNVSSNEHSFGARLDWRLNVATTLTAGAERWSGSTIDLLRDYVENRAFLRIGYTPSAKR